MAQADFPGALPLCLAHRRRGRAAERAPQPGTERAEVERVVAKCRKTALVEVRVLLLASVTHSQDELRIPEALQQVRARPHAVARCPVERRLRAAAIGAVLVEADRRLHEAGSRQAHALAIG